MNRYAYSPVRFSDTNKRYYSSTLYPYYEAKSSDVYIYVTAGDRLDLLAQRYYNDVTKWWIIADVNPGVSKGSMYITPGTRIRIPLPLDDTDINSSLQNKQNNR